MIFDGLKIVTLDYLFESGINTPKRYHKKKRIQKKYIKRYGYAKKVTYVFIKHGDTLYCHSRLLDRLKKGENIKKYL